MAVDHYENFPVASILLPKRLHRPVEVIYNFARQADDFADEGDAPNAERLAKLDAFRAELDRIASGATPETPLFRDLAQVVAEYRLPLQPLRDLLDAFSQDVVQKRYADYAELLDYCRRSANPVGRLMLHLYDEATEVNLIYSDAICSSLQLINFWQDVKKDWAIGRVYLPQEDLARFGITEAHLVEGRMDEAWQALMQFQTQRTRALMRDGKPLGALLSGRIGMEMRLIIAGGLRILDKLESVNFDVFTQRPVLKPLDWLVMLPALIK